jgi:arabinoxylan arabinofuranohydrolase
MKKKSLFLFAFLFSFLQSIAQNPIVPPGIYIADPSSHVWPNGKMYIYGSVDINTNHYCSWKYHVMSSENLIDWTIHKNTFASKGKNDQVPYSDKLLFAPDCQYKNNTYYLYYCQPDREKAEGVAVSKNPEGPFKNGKLIHTGKYSEIDPCVFIDDDGQAYYIWGQFTAKMAKLKPNMLEIDSSTIVDNVVTENEHFFHEGGYMVKRNGIYYFIYAHMGRAQRPTCIGYATSKSPMGPFEYGGIIIDNDHCDPGNWNNHGSIVEYNGQWYVFYHRATHGSQKMRKACIEPITFNEDGSIPEVEMTSQGVGKPLPATKKIDAERACLMFGNIRIQAFTEDNEELGQIYNNDRAAFKYVNFDADIDSVMIRVKPGVEASTVLLRIGTPWGKQIAAVHVEGNKKNSWKTITAPVEPVKEKQALWLIFYGKKQQELVSLDWLKFK